MPTWHFGQSQIKDHQQCHLLYCQKQSSKLKRFIAILDTYSVGGLLKKQNEWKSKHPGLDLNWTVLLYLTFSVPIVTVCTNHSTFEGTLQRCLKNSCCMQGHKIDCLYSRCFGGWGWLRNGWIIIINGNRIWFLWFSIHRAIQNYGYTLNNFFKCWQCRWNVFSGNNR